MTSISMTNVVQWISGNQYGQSGSVESEWTSKGQHYPSASGSTESVWASEGLDILSEPAGPMWPAKAGGLVGPEWASEDQYCYSGSVESEWVSKGQHYPSVSGPVKA